MTDSPTRACPPAGTPALEQHQTPRSRTSRSRPTALLLRPEKDQPQERRGLTGPAPTGMTSAGPHLAVQPGQLRRVFGTGRYLAYSSAALVWRAGDRSTRLGFGSACGGYHPPSGQPRGAPSTSMYPDHPTSPAEPAVLTGPTPTSGLSCGPAAERGPVGHNNRSYRRLAASRGADDEHPGSRTRP
jgi:hypothetical protein